MDSQPELPDQQMGDAEILEAFKAMGPLLLQDRSARDTKEEKEPKKPKRTHFQGQPEPNMEVVKLVRLMGQMILRLDADHQMMRRQDSFVFFLQPAEPALLPQLVLRAKEWHQHMKQQPQPVEAQTDYVPLRIRLFQDLALMMEDRVLKLSKADQKDQLWTVARDHGIIMEDGSFPYQRWNPQQQALIQTKQEHVTMPRMLKYMTPLKEVSRDHTAILKFHSLKQMDGQQTIPWILQTGIRHDEIQSLMEVLQGCTVWGLIGATMKPHTQTQSKQGIQLQQMLGKGKGKHHPSLGKSKGKGKTPSS